MNTNLGLILKTLRIEKKIKQEDLACLLNVHRGTIGKYESGERYPSVDHLITLSNYFNVSLDYLVKGNTERKIENNIIVENIPVISTLSPDKQDLFQNIERLKPAILPNSDINKYFYYRLNYHLFGLKPRVNNEKGTLTNKRVEYGLINNDLFLMEKTDSLQKSGYALLLDNGNGILIYGLYYNGKIKFSKKKLNIDDSIDKLPIIAHAIRFERTF